MIPEIGQTWMNRSKDKDVFYVSFRATAEELILKKVRSDS